ncbi:unnamed protein product, partial [Meganyctiphanes norvegica]
MDVPNKDIKTHLIEQHRHIRQVLSKFKLLLSRLKFYLNSEFFFTMLITIFSPAKVLSICNPKYLTLFTLNNDNALMARPVDLSLCMFTHMTLGTIWTYMSLIYKVTNRNFQLVLAEGIKRSAHAVRTCSAGATRAITMSHKPRQIIIASTSYAHNTDWANEHNWYTRELITAFGSPRSHSAITMSHKRAKSSLQAHHTHTIQIGPMSAIAFLTFLVFEIKFWWMPSNLRAHARILWPNFKPFSKNLLTTYSQKNGTNMLTFYISDILSLVGIRCVCTDLTSSFLTVTKPKSPIAPRVNDIIGSDNTPNKLAVSWEPSTTYFCIGNVTGYIITYHKTGDSDDTSLMIEGVPIEVAQSPYDLVGLEHCTDYTVSVAAKWSRGTGESTTMKGKTGSQAPSKPIVGVETVTTTSIGLSWAQPAADSCPIGEYRVRWNSTSQGSGEDNVGFATSYTITGLSSNTTYTINVDARSDDDKTITSENIIINTDNQEQDIKVKSQLQYGVINITWTPWNDEEFYIVSWDSNTEIANRPEYIIRENEYDGNSTAIQISVCPTMDKARCSVAADRSLQTIVHPIQNLTAEINDDVLLAIWEYSDTNNDEEAIILWDGITDSTSESTWQTDQVNGAPQNVCVSAVIEDDTSRWECTIAEDNNGNGGARLVYSQNVLIPAAIAMIFGILRFNWP